MIIFCPITIYFPCLYLEKYAKSGFTKQSFLQKSLESAEFTNKKHGKPTLLSRTANHMLEMSVKLKFLCVRFEKKLCSGGFELISYFSYTGDIINLLNFIFSGLHGYQITPGLSTNKQRHCLLLLKTKIHVAPTHLLVMLSFGNNFIISAVRMTSSSRDIYFHTPSRNQTEL